MNDILHMGPARRQRADRRAADEFWITQTVAGMHFPTADQIIRGFPFFRGSMASDMQETAKRLKEIAAFRGDPEKLIALRLAGEKLASDADLHAVDDVVLLLTSVPAAVACAEVERVLLRCKLYAAHFGSESAAMELAALAVSRAFVQDWHLVGDGSDYVWRALGWLLYYKQLTTLDPDERHKIALIDSPEIRVMANADELRLRVERCVLEIAESDRSEI